MSRRGFTLLETLIALALTALVLGALSRSLAGAARSRARATAESDRLAGARTILLRLGAELEAAAGEAGIVVEPAGPGPAGSRLRMITTVRTDGGTLPASDRRAISYEVDRAARVLLRREETAPTPPDAAAPAPLAVLAGVRGLTVRCSDGTEWRTRWQSSTLPRAVELVLGVDDGAGGGEALTTTVTVALAP